MEVKVILLHHIQEFIRGGQMRKLTNQEFLDKLHNIKGKEYTPLDNYDGAKKVIRVKHSTCGRVFETTPDKLYNGGCIECGYVKMKKSQRKTNQQFVEEVFKLVGDEYEFIDTYKNNTTKLRVKHNKCNNIYNVTPRDFLSDRRCPYCKGERISISNTHSHEKFMESLSEVLEEDYIVLNKYKNARTKLQVKHVKCGLIYDVLPHKILNGNRCPVCSFIEMGENRAKTHDIFVSEVFETVGSEYLVIGDYDRNWIKITMKHTKCGHLYEVTPDAFLTGNRCPRCRESSGERDTSRILDKYKIKYVPQYKPDGCTYRSQLSFDFALVGEDDVKCLIEYQGIQHYQPVEFFGGEGIFEIQKTKDNIKRTYATNNNIPLIEIPYHVKNIEKYLMDKITKLIPR